MKMHGDDAKQTYLPLNTLKPVAENVWLVDGPLIGFALAGPPRRLPRSERRHAARSPRNVFEGKNGVSQSHRNDDRLEPRTHHRGARPLVRIPRRK
ncbi:protein of unknown function [Hyphomicrobium sp. MC1]|nr:protein of unknown function [Hyphomicrobium sp. MC1]